MFPSQKEWLSYQEGSLYIDKSIKAMISHLLVHMYYALESQANGQIRFIRLMLETFEGMGKRCWQTGSTQKLQDGKSILTP